MQTGNAPFLSRLLDERRHSMDKYLVGAPASTSAFQSGLLYGQVDDVPGYLWYDKRTKKNVRMDRPSDTTVVEQRHDAGGPGLLAGGTSYTTLFRGGAETPTFNLSRLRPGEANSNFRHWPFPMAAAVQMAVGAKIWARLAMETVPEIVETLTWAARVGRLDWEWRLFGLKLLTGIPLREASVWGTIGDMARGVPIIYTCLVDYDEVAHRRGPRSEQGMRLLKSTDRAVETIFAAAAAFPQMGYDVFVFGDHGMTDTTPFAAIEGCDLPAFLSAAEQGDDATRSHVRLRALGDRLLPPMGWAVHQVARTKSHPPAGVEIIDAGDIAHLYFTDDESPLPWEVIERRRPAIVRALRASPAVPFVLARGEQCAVVATRNRVYKLRDETDRAALAALPAFRGPDAETRIGYLERLIGMRSAGDLVLYGNDGPERNIAFSWEFGSHGGIAADETEAFMLHRSEVPFDFGAVTGPEALHRFFLRYRPLLPVRQDLVIAAEAAAPDDLARRRAAVAAISAGAALPDASHEALHSGCT